MKPVKTHPVTPNMVLKNAAALSNYHMGMVLSPLLVANRCIYTVGPITPRFQ